MVRNRKDKHVCINRHGGKKKKLEDLSKVTPALPIGWVLIYQNETDDSPDVINDPWEIWGILTDLQYDFRSRIELTFEDVDQVFVITIVRNPISIKDAYQVGIEKGKQIAFRHSNRIGFVEEDEESGLLCYSN